jgi:hypothetical protein
VAKESRKVRRAQERPQTSGKERKAQLRAPLVASEAPVMPDPLAPDQLRSTFLRVGLIVLGLWLVGGMVAGVSNTQWVTVTALVVPAVLTAVVVGVMIWTIRRTRTAREMQQLLQGVESVEDRRAAIAKLEQSGKKTDPAAVFAKAQLEMQEDPKKALATLESIDLGRVMAPVADEARAQRAMIHLTMGQVNLARQLVDNIDPKRQQDLRSKAMMAAISAEAWARSGETQKAITTLSPYDPNDEQFAQLRPQLLRSLAFAYAHASKTKELKQTLRAMLKIDARLLGAFLQGKGHPLLQKEAKRMIEQSGLVRPKMQFQRH